jgi:uncharacterized RDD family membrane protein YckC
MGDLTSTKLMYLKAILFLAIGLIAAVLLWIDAPTLRTALLLALVIWSFSRAYYFAFYVIEKYVDPTYRFAGLFDFAKYLAHAGRYRGRQSR